MTRTISYMQFFFRRNQNTPIRGQNTQKKNRAAEKETGIRQKSEYPKRSIKERMKKAEEEKKKRSRSRRREE